MIRSHRRGSLSPGEMFPAGDPAYRVSYPRLRSGLRVRVVERGDPESPPVVLIHGWGCSAYVFRRNMPALAEAGFRVIAVDLKGHGLSDKPIAADEYSIDSLVEHLRDILDVLELERPALAGHSLGGSLIYHFASRYPGRASCLGLLSPVGLNGVPLMWLYRGLTPKLLTPILRQIKPRLIVTLALRRVYGRRAHFTERDVEEFLAPSQFPEYALAMRELLHSYDWTAGKHQGLVTVDLPAVGLWGALDHMMPDDGMGVYVPLLPRIVLRVIPDAGHIIAEETPDEVNAALLALFSAHARPNALTETVTSVYYSR
ncbi:MAG TPA: alpha/beta hydrolase [Gemmatimonadaceae bacterium]|nr:alpha/beta hydrolase [Gemmatimonadaceae bacterium]